MVKVWWNDACSEDGWMGSKSDRATEHGPALCTSVGYLYSKDKHKLKVVRDEHGYEGVGGMIAIPRKCITKIVVLKE